MVSLEFRVYRGGGGLFRDLGLTERVNRFKGYRFKGVKGNCRGV